MIEIGENLRDVLLVLIVFGTPALLLICCVFRKQ
jgi:hypothetical protein